MTVGDYNQLLPLQPIDLWKSDHFQNRTIQALMTGFTKHDGSFVLACKWTFFVAMKLALSAVAEFTFAIFCHCVLNMQFTKPINENLNSLL